VAACKVVNLFISPTLGHGTPNTKELQKEVQVHKALKHSYILEFLHSEIVDREKEGEGYVPGLYILLELAVGGDLFDKIGKLYMSPIELVISGLVADDSA
jgi:serine/threonine-protein kinase Chk1